MKRPVKDSKPHNSYLERIFSFKTGYGKTGDCHHWRSWRLEEQVVEKFSKEFSCVNAWEKD